MAVREIPKAFEYSCDWCGVTHLQENASGHYTESTPDGWLRIKTYGSGPKRSGHQEELICEHCADVYETYVATARKKCGAR